MTCGTLRLLGEPGSLVGAWTDLPEVPVSGLFPRPSEWRRDALRTTLWLVPTLQVLVAGLLFAVTYGVDRGAYDGELTLPAWVNNGSADAARQILTAIAAAVITVVGLVFSITIVALTLVSTQFGPRILRNFVRDRGTQITLGTFVATFVYTLLALGSISHGQRGDFVPHLSITVDFVLMLAASSVLIYFIDHIAKSIQLPQVIASIARDLSVGISTEVAASNGARAAELEAGPSLAELQHRLEQAGETIPAARTGYLQFIAYADLVDIASQSGGVIRLLHHPGHFVVEGLPLADVWPRESAQDVARRLERAHVTGPHRTLTQDLTFAIDQLVEIAIRALSPAVNDTFTAMTCIDWLTDGLCKLTAQWNPRLDHRDRQGQVRVIAAQTPYDRFVHRAFDKIRQAARGMPAVLIRQLEGLARIVQYTRSEEHRQILTDQADMLLSSSEESVPEPADRAGVRRRYDAFVMAAKTRS